MRLRPGSLILALLALLTALGLGWYYQALAREFPFDVIWDMDITAAQDVLLLNSGETPAHLDHPKYVMAVVQAAEAGLLRQSGQLSTASLEDLAAAPQPLLGLAELTDTLRGLHSFSAWLLLLLLTGLLWLLFPAQGWLALLALPLLGLQAGLLYNALTMRTELYSALLIGLGLLLLIGLWRPGSRPGIWPQRLGVLGLGLLLGLALLNKSQALSLFFLVPLFAAYCYIRWQQAPEAPETPVPGRWPVLVLGLSLLIFVPLALAALWVPPLPGRVAPILDWQVVLQGLPGSLARLKLQLFWLGYLASGLLAPLLARRLPQRWAWGLSLYPLLPAGTLLAFLLPLGSLLGHAQGLSKGWHYLANLMRSTVWFDAALLTSGSNSSARTLSYLLQHRLDLLLLALAALFLLGAGLRERDGRLAAAGAMAVILASLMTLVLGNRPLLRDTLWVDVWISWAALLGLGHLLAGPARSWRPLVRSLPWLMVAAVTLSSLLLAGRELESFYLYHAPYGGDIVPYDDFLTKSVYLRGDNPYSRIFDQVFEAESPRVRRAIVQARDWRQIQSRISHPFVNSRVPLRAAGLLENGFPAWKRAGSWARLEQVKPQLQGATLLVLADIRPRAGSRRYLNDLSNKDFQGDLKAAGAPVLTLVPPFNYSLMLALAEADVSRLGWLMDEAPAFRVMEQGKSIAYQLYRLEGVIRLDQRKLAQLLHPPLAVIYSASVQPPELPNLDLELTKKLGAVNSEQLREKTKGLSPQLFTVHSKTVHFKRPGRRRFESR